MFENTGRTVRNQAVVAEEEEGYARELFESLRDESLSETVLRDIRNMSFAEVIS